jgi:orotate phosphoribosyltransferase
VSTPETTTGDEALSLLREVGAVLEGHFQLASLRHSGVYFEKFRLLQYPAHTELLCRRIADHFRVAAPTLVAGPTTGGVIVAYEVARQLGKDVRAIVAERVAHDSDRRHFARGFEVRPRERTLVVDDVLTTGGSLRLVLDAVREAGGEPIGVGVLVDRTDGIDLGAPLFAALRIPAASYEASDCPLCRAGLPLTIT